MNLGSPVVRQWASSRCQSSWLQATEQASRLDAQNDAIARHVESPQWRRAVQCGRRRLRVCCIWGRVTYSCCFLIVVPRSTSPVFSSQDTANPVGRRGMLLLRLVCVGLGEENSGHAFKSRNKPSTPSTQYMISDEWATFQTDGDAKTSRSSRSASLYGSQRCSQRKGFSNTSAVWRTLGFPA